MIFLDKDLNLDLAVGKTKKVDCIYPEDGETPLQFVKRLEETINLDMPKSLMKHCRYVLASYPEIIYNGDLAKRMFDLVDTSFIYMPDDIKTEAFCEYVLQKEPYFITYIKPEIQTPNLCLLAAKLNSLGQFEKNEWYVGSPLESIKEEFKTKEICLLFAKGHSYNVDHIPEEYFKDKDFLVQLAESNPRAICRVSYKIHIPEDIYVLVANLAESKEILDKIKNPSEEVIKIFNKRFSKLESKASNFSEEDKELHELILECIENENFTPMLAISYHKYYNSEIDLADYDFPKNNNQLLSFFIDYQIEYYHNITSKLVGGECTFKVKDSCLSYPSYYHHDVEADPGVYEAEKRTDPDILGF